MASLHPLSLEPILRCPQCGKSYHAAYLQTGMPECQKDRCRARWWATLLQPGAVQPQLARTFEDEAIAEALVELHGLPRDLPERRFWQLLLAKSIAHEHRGSSPQQLFRALFLLQQHRLLA